MGIYSDGKIYGISLFLSDVILYMKKYPYEMGLLEITEIRNFYETLSEQERLQLEFLFWVKSSTTYEPTVPNEYMHSVPVNRLLFENLLFKTERS